MEDVENKLKDYEIVREGEAEIIINKKIAANEVFYNPVQVLLCICSVCDFFGGYLMMYDGFVGSSIFLEYVHH